jgi:hypothetical protein
MQLYSNFNDEVIVLLLKVLKDAIDFRAAAVVHKQSVAIPGASCDALLNFEGSRTNRKNLRLETTVKPLLCEYMDEKLRN